jgi:hypothetical protein
MGRTWFVLLVCVLNAAASVRADDTQQAPEARAQALFERGLQLSADERWGEARAAFLECTRLTPRASAYFNLAVSSLELGLGRAALDALERFDALSDPLVQPDYRKRAVELRQRALTRVGTLELSIAPAEAQLEIDGNLETATGASRVVLVDPGSHLVRISAPGRQTRTLELTIGARDTAHSRVELAPVALSTLDPAALLAAPHAAVTLTPRPAPAQAPAPARSLWSHPVTWIVIGTLVAIGVTGAVVAASGGTSDPYGGSVNKVFDARR